MQTARSCWDEASKEREPKQPTSLDPVGVQRIVAVLLGTSFRLHSRVCCPAAQPATPKVIIVPLQLAPLEAQRQGALHP